MTSNENSEFEYEHTIAADFEICEDVQEFIKRWKSIIGEECCNFMEDSYRGLSPQMQLVMCHRFMTYLLHGDYSSTGVKHTDTLLGEIIEKLPKDFSDYLETQRPKHMARKMGIIMDYDVLN